MTETDQVNLAGRMGPETWGRLCADDRFLHALATDDVDYTQVVMEILTSDWANVNLTTIPTLSDWWPGSSPDAGR